MTNTKAAPFQHFALSLSGGGYRAAAFHLGTMSYQHHAQWKGSPLIQELAVVSTISGGTITGMKYALSLAEQQPFAVFYKGLYSFLKEDILLGKALETLNNSAPWSGLPLQRNLINAFALIYDLLEHNDLSEQLKTYIVQANQMGTTLWFSDPAAAGVSMPDALVVACPDRFSAV